MGVKKKTSIATGLVRPKTTALFFDKLWVPIVPDRFDYIPEELLFMNLPQELLLKGLPPRFQRIMSNRYWLGWIGSRRLDDYFTEIFERLKATGESELGKIEFPDEVIFDPRRNGTLLRIADTCKREINMDVTPIFIEKRVFKTSAASWVNHLSGEFEGHEAIPNRKINILEVCIKNIPTIIDEQLHWEQVLEVRQDKISFDSIKRLKRWLNAEFAGKSEGEIIEGLEKRIESYII